MTVAAIGASGPFLGFGPVLRQNGFLVSAEQTVAFLGAVHLLGAGSPHPLLLAARSVFAIPPERLDEFDDLFRSHFTGELLSLPAAETDESCREDEPEQRALTPQTAWDELGRSASSAERLSERKFHSDRRTELQKLVRRLPRLLPRRVGFRFSKRCRRGRLDLRRSLAGSVRTGGELIRPLFRKRKDRQRNILLLIDISGSMREHTADGLAFSHTLALAAERFEAFTLGTRLTRITPLVRRRERAAALEAASAVVADWDSGTRLGATIQQLLQTPRYLNFCRGAAIIILSDGLERDDPSRLIAAVKRLRGLAWRLSWATPLAADPRYRPETAAMKAILPMLDDLVDGASASALVAQAVALAERAPPAARVWTHPHPPTKFAPGAK